MNKALFNLALLSSSKDKDNKNFIDYYIPLFSKLIVEQELSEFNRDKMRDLLDSEYGINIPLGAVEGILKHMREKKLLNGTGQLYISDYSKLAKQFNTEDHSALSLAFDNMVQGVIEYAKSNFDITMSPGEVEEAIIAFMQEYDLSILYYYKNEGVLEKIQKSKKVKYIIASYIAEIYKNNPGKFLIFKKINTGYTISSLLVVDNLSSFVGSLKNVEVYLDAPIIFSLLGINGASNYEMVKQLVEILQKNGASIRIFITNYNEVITAIQVAIDLLRSGHFDLSISTRIIKTAIRENISAQMLQDKLHTLDPLLKKYSIIIEDNLTLLESELKYQIDEGLLFQMFEKELKGKEIITLPEQRKKQIERDVESIAGIFKIRKNNMAISFKKCKAIFLTNNNVNARVSRWFEEQYWEYKSQIPVCVTDIFLSTILWANYPESTENLNIKRLICECSSLMTLDNALLNKLYNDVATMEKENIITKEEANIFRASHLTAALLEKKTFNDPEEYTDKTAAEILEDIKIELKREVVENKRKHEVELQQKDQNHSVKITNLTNELIQENQKVEKYDNLIRVISKIGGVISFWIILLLSIGAVLFFRFYVINSTSIFITIPTVLIISLIACFGLLRWAKIIPEREKIQKYFEKLILKRIRKMLK
jgi:hypothetical protein